jgi:dTDP-4-amino-4,6-dideoxygalactose transaminase
MSFPLLAIDGGPPACLARPTWPPLDREVREALERAQADGSWGSYHGRCCQQLVDALAAYLGLRWVTLCCSGTIAVELALRGVGVAAGDEVILAGYDFPGNFRAIEAIGARPVLVDVDPENWNLDVGQVQAAVSSTTKAVVVSHLHGGLVPMAELVEIARSHAVAVVEDACQAPGAVIQGRKAGTWGDVGVLSFGGSKLLTAGRGGALLTEREDVHQRAKLFNERGNLAFPLSELQAAVLPPQLNRLDQRNQARAARVDRLLTDMKELRLVRPLVNHAAGQAAYYKLGLRYEGTEQGPAREEFLAAVQAEGVPLDSGFRGFALRSPRRCRVIGELVQSRLAAERMMVLHHPVLLEPVEVMDSVVEALRKVEWHLLRLSR